VKRVWAELRLATAFLTLVPVGPAGTVAPIQLARSLTWFPLVGLLLGLLLAGIDLLLEPYLPATVVVGLSIVLLVLLTGGLHLDGVADLADGLGGGRDPAARLRIMKDSRVGAMGVIALILLLLLKYQALAAFPAGERTIALLLMPAAGRWLPVLLAVTSPYARPEGGTGGAFIDHAGGWQLLGGTGLLLALALYLCSWTGAFVVLLLALAAFLFRALVMARLGGVTGDVLGAAVEGGEVLTLLLLLLVHPTL